MNRLLATMCWRASSENLRYILAGSMTRSPFITCIRIHLASLCTEILYKHLYMSCVIYLIKYDTMRIKYLWCMYVCMITVLELTINKQRSCENICSSEHAEICNMHPWISTSVQWVYTGALLPVISVYVFCTNDCHHITACNCTLTFLTSIYPEPSITSLASSSVWRYSL